MASPYTLEVIHQVANITDTTVHIVFVPGIEVQLSPIWDKDESDDHSLVHRIEDFLPADLPTATILKFKYKNSLTWTSQSIESHGKKLLLELHHFRASRSQKSQPIIFIGHSLGGLIVKKALATSFQSQYNTTYRDISRATTGIVFLGTPHSSRPSLVKQLDDIVHASIQGTDRSIHRMGVVHLASDILDGFVSLATWVTPWLTIFSFFEELPVPGQKNPVVGFNDAEIPGHSKLPIQAHHLDIFQFRSHTSPGYMQVLASLKSIWQLSLPRPSLYGLGQSIHTILPSSISRFNEGLRGIPEAAAGTCNWILDSVPFKTWLHEDSGIFWVQGKPGSGKSTLLRFVAQKLLSRPASFGLKSAASFYFFSPGKGEVRNTGGDVISFLREHLMPHVQGEKSYGIYEGFVRNSEIEGTESKPAWSFAALSKLNTTLTTIQGARLQDPIVLFIDGLDELEESITVTTFIWAILSMFPTLYSLRVFVSSRIQPQLKQVTRIRLEDNNKTDIWTYCRSKLMTKDVSYRDFLAQEIASRANGVFLWVKLVVSQLGHLHSGVDISQIKLPSDLSEAFGWTMDHLLKNGKNTDITKSLLRLATFALRPLSIYEIQHALGTASFICSHICEQCSEGDGTADTCFLGQDELSYRHMIISVELLTWGLLEVVDGTVCFIHYSVRTRLLQRIATQERPDVSHQELALRCLEYLRETISDLGDTLEKGQKPITSIYPFLEYATLSWMHHLRLSGPVSDLSTTQDILHDFMLPTSDFRDGWIIIYNQLSPSPKRFSRRTTTPLHVICCFGIPIPSNEACEIFSQYCDTRDHAGRTPLSLACEMGHAELCSNLILMGADYRIRDKVYGQTALGWAIAEGHNDVVQILLRHGADPKDHLSGTAPLHLAIQRLDVALVKLLLQNGADPRTLDNYTGWSALSLASNLGNTDIMSLLLDWGAEVLGKDQGNGWTPLHHAIFKGRQSALGALITVLSYSNIQELKYDYPSRPFGWVDRVLSYSIGGMCCVDSGGKTSPQSSTASRTDVKRRITSSSSSNNKRKRSMKAQNNTNYDNEGRDEDEDDSRSGGDTPSDRAKGYLRFACPYEKAYPREHCCSFIGFSDMYRVKSHVLEKHEVKRCWHCNQSFRGEAENRNHASSCDRIKIEIQFEKGFDGTQRDDIKATKTAGSGTKHWIRVFELCFPTWNLEIPSPYHDDVATTLCRDETLGHMVALCRDANHGNAVDILRDYILGLLTELNNRTGVNRGRISTIPTIQRQPADLYPARSAPTPTSTDSIDCPESLHSELQPIIEPQGAQYNSANPPVHNTRTPYSSLLRMPPASTSTSRPPTSFSRTSRASNPWSSTSSGMGQSTNSSGPRQSISDDQLSLPGRSIAPDQANPRYREGQENSFAITGFQAIPSTNFLHGGTTGVPAIQGGDQGVDRGPIFPAYTTSGANNEGDPIQTQPSMPWDSNESHLAVRQQSTRPISSTTNPAWLTDLQEDYASMQQIETFFETPIDGSFIQFVEDHFKDQNQQF